MTLRERAETAELAKSGSVEVLRARLIQHQVLGDFDLSWEGIQSMPHREIGEVLKIFGIKSNDLENNKKYQFKALIITSPYPQLKKLAKKYLDRKISNLKVQMQPNITVMVAFKNQKNLPVSSIKFDDETLAWAANENSKKRFKSNLNLWTLQASLKWSKKKINNYKNNNLSSF